MIKLTVPAQRAKPGPPLSPALGQHQIKVAEFVADFNARTLHYSEGLPVGCRIRKQGSKWTLTLRPPTVAVLLSGLVDPVRLWSALEFRFGPVFGPGHARTFLGSAQSARLHRG